MKWVIVNAATGELDRIPAAFNPDHEDMTGMTAIERDVPEDYPEHHDWMPTALDFVENLSRLDARLIQEIDAAAGAMRRSYITDVPGQQLVYQRKAEQAHQWNDALIKQDSDYPALMAEAAASGMTMAELVAEILASEAEWLAISDAIEAARMAGKRAVKAASTREAKEAAAQIDWAIVVQSVEI